MKQVNPSQFVEFVSEIKEKIRSAQYEALKAVNNS